MRSRRSAAKRRSENERNYWVGSLSAATSMCQCVLPGGAVYRLPPDRRAHDGRLGNSIARKRLNDAPAVDHHDLITEIYEFRNFRRIEQHCAAGVGVLTDDMIDFGLSADIDAPGGVVQEQNAAVGQEPLRNRDLLLVA